MTSRRSQPPSRPSAEPSQPSSDADRVRAIYDGLRDAVLVLDGVHDRAAEGPDSEASWRALQAMRDALVCTFRLHQRCDRPTLRLLEQRAGD
jgi:hypothetical protein